MMDDPEMPTVILKSIKDFNKVLKEESASCINKLSPRQKLNFSDSSGNITCDLADDDETSSISTQFIKKHQDNIAGLVIAKNIREKDSELLEAKASLSVHESKLQNLQTFMKKYRVDHEREIDNLRTERSRDKELIKDLNSQLTKYQNNEANIKEKMFAAKTQLKERTNEWESKYLSLQKSSSDKTNEMLNELSNLREKVAALEKNLSQTSNSVNDLELKNKDLEESNKNLRSRVMDTHQSRLEIEKLQLKLAQTEAKNNELEMRMSELKERDDQVHMFDNAITQLPQLRKQISKLKEENHLHRLSRVNTELLEEKLSSTEDRLKVTENRCNEIVAENATLRALRELMEEYEVAVKKEFKVDYLPPIREFTSMLQSLQKKDQVVNDSICELKASLESHSASLEHLETENKKLTDELTKKKEELLKTSHITNRLQRKMVLLSKERDNLKEIIASYESESTMMLSSLERERVTRLESQLQDYKTEISKLESELESFQSPDGQRHAPRQSIAPQNQDSIKLMKEIEELKVKVQQLIEEKELLQDQLEKHGFQGGFDPQRTKVLNFQENPLEKASQERSKQLENLSRENESLKKRIKLLEEGEKDDLTVKVGMKVDEASSQRVLELEKKVSSLEQRNDKIIDSFKEKSHEMREIVYRLLGYRVDFMGNKNYRLSNIFSESKDDFLLFEQTSEGMLQLLETDFSDTLEVLIETYLHQDDSYPLFLSALTLDLHKRQAGENDSASSSEAEEEDAEAIEEVAADDEEREDDDEVEEIRDDEEQDDEVGINEEDQEDCGDEEGETREEYGEGDDPLEEGEEEEPGILDEEIEDEELEDNRDEEEEEDLEDESEIDEEEEEDYEDEDDFEEPPPKRSKTQVEQPEDSDDDLICLD